MSDISKFKLEDVSYTIKDTVARDGLTEKQDILISGTSIKTVNNISLLGSGNLNISASSIEITYSELVALRDAGSLTPGLSYRITDYQCTTTQRGTTSAGHPFDIMVTADSEDTLSESARAILHVNDSYFANSNLGAWELKYCLDNNSEKFAWADEVNGKGIIYYMKDEFDNECPYDFKNIQFYRQWNSNTQMWSDISTSTDGIPAYTFSSLEIGTVTSFNDQSIDATNYVSSNVIKRRTSTDTSIIDDLLRLNNTCFFGVVCYNNVFGESCYNNTFGSNCRNNTFGADCYWNCFKSDSSYNTFGNGCSFNTFGTYCKYNTFGDDCDHNIFGGSCSCNTLEKACCYTLFSADKEDYRGDFCSNIIVGSNCGNKDAQTGIIVHSGYNNIFDANIKNLELLGEKINNYHILSSVSYEGTTEKLEFHQVWYSDFVIHSINSDEMVVSFFDTTEEEQIDNITLYFDGEDEDIEGIYWWADENWDYYVCTDSTSDIHCQIGDEYDIIEIPGKLTINATPESECVITVGRKSNGKIVQYCEADLIADQD